MIFRAADAAAIAGGAAPNESSAPAPVVADPAEETAEQTFEQKLRVALGLAETATDDEVLAALPAPGTDLAALQTQASTAADLQTQLDAKVAEVNKAYEDMDALRKQQAEAQADDILKVYEGQFTDDASKAAIRAILVSDREAGIAILNGLKKPEAANPAGAKAPVEEPPAPTHDPKKAEQQASETELANKISARAKELVAKSNPKISLTKAYQQAEGELKPKS